MLQRSIILCQFLKIGTLKSICSCFPTCIMIGGTKADQRGQMPKYCPQKELGFSSIVNDLWPSFLLQDHLVPLGVLVACRPPRRLDSMSQQQTVEWFMDYFLDDVFGFWPDECQSSLKQLSQLLLFHRSP